MAAICCAIALASCATWPSGPKYPDHPASRFVVPPESSRLTIYRVAPEVKWNFPKTAGTATLRLDGNELGDIRIGQFHVRDVSPGRHVMRIDFPSTPGACELSVDTAGGEVYFFEVDARSSYAWAAMPGQVLWSIPLAGLVVGPLAFAAGTAIESAGKTCGGPFSIVSVDRDIAIPKLADMQSEK